MKNGKIMKRLYRITAIAACFVISSAAFADNAAADQSTVQTSEVKEGDVIGGFTVETVTVSEAYSADVYVLEHDASGARAVIISNDDPNRFFMLGFGTCVTNNRGCAHVFEHSAANGSVQYPSRSLISSLTGRGYATYANAFTQDRCTVFPVGASSEEQLLKLAGYYAGLCFAPLMMEDEDIFRSEAWRLMMTDEDGDIELGGTIYSEMKTGYTASLSALKKAVGLLYPGSSASYVAGGIPNEIMKLTYEDVKEFWSRYYVAGNCTAYLYGDINDPGAFLEMLDGYFSSHGGSAPEYSVSAEQKTPGFTEKTYAFPAYRGEDCENGTEIVYAIDFGDPSDEELMDLYAFRNICNSSSSTPVRMLKSAFPSSDFEFGIESEEDFTVLTVSAHGMKKEDAGLFAECAGKVFSLMASEGLGEKEIDNFRRKKNADFLLSREGRNKPAALLSNIALLDSGGRGELFYLRMQDGYEDMSWFSADTIKRISAEAADPARSAAASVVPAPGLAEENDAALREALDTVKASMKPEDRKKLVEDTERIAQKAYDDPAQYLKELGAAGVSSLDIPKEPDVSDETEDGVRKIGVMTDMDGVCLTQMYLDVSHVPYEMLGYLSLYTDLVNGNFVDTESHERNDLPETIGACTLRGQEISLETSSAGRGYTPYVTADFLCAPDELDDAFSVAYERLFSGDFGNAAQIMEGVSAIKRTVRSNIENHPENAMISLSLSDKDNGAAYYEHTHYIGYYDFLDKLESGADAADICKKLSEVRDLMTRPGSAVIGYAVSPDNKAEYEKAAGAFTGKLSIGESRPCVYGFEEHEYPLAVVTGKQTVSNVISADAEKIGMKDGAAADVALSIMKDVYLRRSTRDRYGAYTCSFAYDYPAVSVYTSTDPSAGATLDAFLGMPDAWKAIRSAAGEADLEGYITAEHSEIIRDDGMLSSAGRLISDMVSGRSADRSAGRVRELRELTPEDLKECDTLFDGLASDKRMVTIGSGTIINRDRECYAKIISPFAN